MATIPSKFGSTAKKLLLPLVAAAVMLGCAKSADVERYQVTRVKSNKPKIPAAGMPRETAATAQSMIGAIFLRGTKAWFFKVTAAPEVMEKRSAEVNKFLETVRFAADGDPQWDQPEGWQRLPGNQFRFATVRMGSAEDSPEIAISSLGKEAGDDENYLLANINRWRGQLQLAPLTAETLAKESEQRKAGDEAFTYVAYTGKSSAGGGMGGPFAGKRPPAAPPVDRPAASDDGPKFTLPEGWQKVQPASSFAKLAFRVEDGETKLDITVSPLAGAAGGLAANVNRWREQVKLESLAEDALLQSLRDIKSSGETGKLAELIGEKDAILGAIVMKNGTSWFIKAQGASPLAEREKARFVEFVEKLELP